MLIEYTQKENVDNYFVYVSEVSANTYAPPYPSKMPTPYNVSINFHSWCLI